MSCPICVEDYVERKNNTKRRKVVCNFCNNECCRKCIETYLLNSQQDIPHCMHCRKEWSKDFLCQITPNTFYNVEYRNHQADVLMDKETSLLPQTQDAVERILDMRKQKKQIEETCNEIWAQIQEKQRELNNLYNHYNHTKQSINFVEVDKTKKEKKKFIRACPLEDCRGFLSTQWKCGTCECWFCSKCMDPKDGKNDETHECDPDKVKTVELININTKPCPGCGEGIFKIEGCFGEDVEIAMWNGGTKKAKDIQVGDFLFGDDGTSRRVEELCQGIDDMYEVQQESMQGDAYNYIVSSYHQLALHVQLGNHSHKEDIITRYFVNDLPMSYRYNGYRKLLVKSESHKDLTRINVVPIGKGKYYGWRVYGKNNKFLLKDGTVSNNCSQMFCTSCNTPFDWKTGKKITGVLHNPHYFEWQRTQNGPRNEQIQQFNQANLACGGMPDFNNVRHKLTNAKVKTEIYTMPTRWRWQQPQKINSIDARYRIVNHIREVVMPRYQSEFTIEQNEDLRIAYLLKELDKDKWKITLKKRHKKAEKDREVHQVLDMFTTSMTDLFLLINDTNDNEKIKKHWNDMQKLKNYTNGVLEKIQYRFKNKTPRISNSWQMP